MADVSKIRKFRDADDYRRNFVVQGEIDKYLPGGKHFIDEAQIARCISEIAEKPADPVRVREIIAKSESTCETLLPEETAVLMSVTDPALFEEMRAAADRIKHKVYDNRIVMFAPLYVANRSTERAAGKRHNGTPTVCKTPSLPLRHELRAPQPSASDTKRRSLPWR